MTEVVNLTHEEKRNSYSTYCEKYLTFLLGKEVYAFPILNVQEIIGLMNITRVPKTAEFICGIINLRGKVVPVIDLRSRFNLPTVEASEKSCIVVVQIEFQQNVLTMGILVDEVSEVLDIKKECIEEPPNFGKKVTTEFVSGIGKLEKKVVILLNVEKILNVTETEFIKETVEGTSR